MLRNNLYCLSFALTISTNLFAMEPAKKPVVSPKPTSSPHAQSAQEQVVYGSAHFENAHLKGLKSYGSTVLRKTNIKGLVQIYGSFKASEGSLGELEVYGPAKLWKIGVSAKTLISGPLDASDSTFALLRVLGPAHLEDVTAASIEVHGPLQINKGRVKGESKILGELKADRVQFNDQITVAAHYIEIRDCQLKGIKVLKSTNDPRPQKLVLQGSTEISGPIVFESGNGHVIIKNKTVKLSIDPKGAQTEKTFNPGS